MGEHVLVVDDDPTTLLVLGDMLTDLNIPHLLASSASECLANLMATPERFRAIIMDIHMPALMGTEAARWIKDGEEDTLANIPIIALTADPNFGELDTVSPFGMLQVLLKPLQLADLDAVLRTL